MPTMQTAVAPYNQTLTGQPVGPAVVDPRTDAQVAAPWWQQQGLAPASDWDMAYINDPTKWAQFQQSTGQQYDPNAVNMSGQYELGRDSEAFQIAQRDMPGASSYRYVNLNGITYVVGLNAQGQPIGPPVGTNPVDRGDFMRDALLLVAGGYFGGSALAGAGLTSAPTAAAVAGGAGGGTGVYGGALAGAGGATAAGGAATNAALAESAVGTAGYGASSAGAGGMTAAVGGGAATNAALAESAVGTPGYGASSAGAGGGAGTVAGGTGSTVGSGAWNGTNFTGATNAGASAMGVGDWISLLQLGAGLWASDQASSNASGATAAAAAVAQGQLQLSRDAFDWYRTTYANEAPLREGAATRQNAIADQQIRGMQFAVDQAQELDQYNRTTFRPVEQRRVQEATTYDTPERRAQAAASAAADVDMSANAARQANDRALARAGVAPGSARAQALAEDSAVRQAAARGGAMTGAARQVEQQGYARMADVANLGRGIATQQATQQNIATTTGSAGASAAGQALQSATSGTPTMTQGFNTAINGMSSAGNLFNSVASSQRQDDQMLLRGINGIGQWAGNRYGTSDPQVKKGTGKMADAAKALREIEQTPVHDNWEYDPAKGAPPGSGGQKMTGPMADDVRRVSGEASAPGGKVIDLVKQQGRMLAAIQALSKDVKALKREELEAA